MKLVSKSPMISPIKINGNRIIPVLTAVEDTVPDMMYSCYYPFLWITSLWMDEPN